MPYKKIINRIHINSPKHCLIFYNLMYYICFFMLSQEKLFKNNLFLPSLLLRSKVLKCDYP